MNGDKENKQAALELITNGSFLGFHKINLLSIAVALGKEDAIEVASKRYDLWMGLDNATLIELCTKTNDTDSIEHCMEKIIDGQGSLNLESLL